MFASRFVRPSIRPQALRAQSKIATFGSAQYKWNPPRTRFMAHAEIAAAPTVVAYTNGTADPDGPILRSQQNGTKETLYDLPASSVVVIRGNVATH